MPWNLLAYALPTFDFFWFISRFSPKSYTKFANMTSIDQPHIVVTIAEKVLRAENVPDSKHFRRIQNMLEATSRHIDPKNIYSLLCYRLKAIKAETDELSVFTTGTDWEDGKYYIVIKSDQEIEKALPWIITHELSHILNEDRLETIFVTAIASFAAVTFSILILRWSLLASLGSATITRIVTHITWARRSERVADDFAIKHCSKEELQEGITYLELLKVHRTKSICFNSFMLWLLHPSEDSRIAKIRKALIDKGKMA